MEYELIPLFKVDTCGSHQDLCYENTCDIDMIGRRPVDSWLKEWTLEERINKFITFLNIYDLREDKILRDEYQIFSHRLHWDEHPFCNYIKKITNNRDRLWYTLYFSFSNEHWKNLKIFVEEGEDALKKAFRNGRHSRNDLFQVWYPKGTKVEDWLIYETKKAADALCHHLENIDRPYTMMEFAKILETYFNTVGGFKYGSIYPSKNTARYIAMTWPDLVNPESVLLGGTGHFTGLQQIFGGKSLEGKSKYSIGKDGAFICENESAELWMEQMQTLKNHPANPIKRHLMLNIEDKTCFFYKHLAISVGVKTATKTIPYTWIFDADFNLSKNTNSSFDLTAETTKHIWGREYSDEIL